MSVLTTLVVRLTGDVSEFNKKIDSAVGMATSFGSKVQSGLNTALNVGAIGATAMGAALGAAAWQGLSFNNSMEQTRAKLSAFLPDAASVEKTLAMVQERAAKTPFEFDAMAAAAAALIPTSKMAGVELESLIETAEILAASNPAEGLEGAAFALKEAVSGDFASIIERFNLPRSRLKELRDQGVPDLEAVRIAMSELGLSTELVTNLANTATGRWSTLQDTFTAIAGKLTEPIFNTISNSLGTFNDLIAENQPMIDSYVGTLATKIADVVEAGSNFASKVVPGVSSFISALREGKDPLTAFTAFAIAVFDPKTAIEYFTVIDEKIRPFLDQNIKPMVEWLEKTVFRFTEWKDVLFVLGVIALAVVIPALWGMLFPIIALAGTVLVLVVVTSYVRTAWEENWWGMRDAVMGVVDQVKPFFDDFEGSLGKLLNRLEPLLPRITAITGALILIGSLYVVPMLIAGIAAGMTWLSGVALGLWFALMNAGGILGVLGSVVAFLGGPITLAIAAVIAVSALLYVAWTENWWGIQEATAQFVVDVLEGWELVKAGAMALVKVFSDKVDEIATAWEQKDWGTLAYNIINLLSGGMLSGIPMAIEAALKVAQAIWDSITGYFTGAGDETQKEVGGKGKGRNGNSGGSGGASPGNGSPGAMMVGQTYRDTSVQGVGRARVGEANLPSVVVYIQAPIYGVNDLERVIEQAVDKIARKSASKKRV